MNKPSEEDLAIVIFKASFEKYAPSSKAKLLPSWDKITPRSRRRYKAMAKAVLVLFGKAGNGT